MRKSLLASPILLTSGMLGAQSPGFWSNYGALVSIKDTAFLSVNGDMYNNNGGHYNNSDTIFLTGDWIHSATNHAFDSIDKGYVYLYAGEQHIKGVSETNFYNLILKGTGIKHCEEVDCKVDGMLDLTDREFSAGDQTIWVRNANRNAIHRTLGYVSATYTGGLARNTNKDTAYYFPVGSSFGLDRFRPMELTPTSANLNQYKVRFANVDPDIEGFYRNDRFHLVCSVNPNWYHRVYHLSGTDSAEIAIYYDLAVDGLWNDIVHWQNVPEWQSIHKDTLENLTFYQRMSKAHWNGYDYSPFALALTSLPFAQAGVDTIIWKYDTIKLNSSGGMTYNWTPAYNLSNTNTADPLAYPEESSTYYLTVEDGTGCTDYDSLRIMVRNKPISNFNIPDVITPNGDGFNDFWHIRDLERYPDNSMHIINRWGDVVYDEKPYQQHWEGTYKGEPLPGGTYYYIIKVKDEKGQEAVFNGPITVVR